MKNAFDIVIIGAGLVGLTTALACAASGASVALLDQKQIKSGTDNRVSALSTTSLQLFKNLGVTLSDALQPIQDMLVTEGSPNSAWRLHFEGDGDGGDLGAIIENQPLKRALIDRVKTTSSIQLFAPTKLVSFEDGLNCVSIKTSTVSLKARQLVAADGRNSNIRKSAGMTVQRFDYDAASLVTIISHALPHDGLAWQRIIKGGALAVLPLPGLRSQIVWSGPQKAIKAASELSDNAFLAILSEKMDGYLGDMNLLSARQSYPLHLQIADRFTSGRIALAGDAAHVIHPLAGQGLNLGLRDAAALAAGVKSALETGQDIGVASLLDYELWRNADTRALGLLTHAISESSGSRFSAIGHLRRLGLTAANRSPTLKSVLKNRAAGEGQTVPPLMRNDT